MRFAKGKGRESFVPPSVALFPNHRRGWNDGEPMSEILIRNADAVVTMNAGREEIAQGDVLIRGGVIAAAGCLGGT